MPASPIDPPLGAPVRELKSANTADGFYWELVSRESMQFQLYSPIKRGTKYSDIRGAKQSVIDAHTGGLWFCEEIVPLRSSQVGGMPGDRFVIWVWSTDWAAQSSTNAGVTYAENNASYPIYTREYLIRRDVWQTTPTLTIGNPLTALIGVTITAGGTGYTAATGTVGNATVVFVCSGGAIISAIVTSEGSSITSGASLTITGDGAGATATAVIQPATALLVKQEKRELPADSNLSKEFVLVLRTYETLPGPTITSTSVDIESGVSITTAKTKKKLSDITAGVTTSSTNVVLTEKQAIDAYVGYEIVTTIPEPTNNSLGSALISYRTMGYQFPARIDIAALDLYGTAIGYRRPAARIVLATIKTYWVVSASTPTLTIDEIIPNSLYINNVKYEDVLHNLTTRYYNSTPFTYLATTPSYTEYTTGWIGQQKLIAGEVMPTKFKLLWKVEATFLVMR